MEVIVLLGNLLLAISVGGCVWLLYSQQRQSQQTLDHYREILLQQLRLTTLPHLYWDMAWQGEVGQISLDVFNVGSAPAYDVHISLIGAYTEESMDIPSFMRTCVQPRYRKYPLQADKVGYYGVRSSLRLSLVPAQKKMTVPLVLPIRPADVYTLLQYRDLSGENYYQICCFSALDESGGYRANVLEPKQIQPLERLHFYDLETMNFPDSGAPLPYYLEDFVELWNHSLSARLMIQEGYPPSPVRADVYDL